MAELCPLNGYAEILKESELNDLNGKKQTISFIEMVSTKVCFYFKKCLNILPVSNF